LNAKGSYVFFRTQQSYDKVVDQTESFRIDPVVLFASKSSPDYKEACSVAAGALDSTAKVILEKDSATLKDWLKSVVFNLLFSTH
jgi:hypothetical protein